MFFRMAAIGRISLNSGSYAAKTELLSMVKKWEREGFLDRVLGDLLREGINKKKINLSSILIDGTFFPSLGGGEQVDYGYKGNGVLIQLLAEKFKFEMILCAASARN